LRQLSGAQNNLPSDLNQDNASPSAIADPPRRVV
jgi:hypothetical protein